MKQIPLSQGMFAIVDDEDFEWLNQWKWSYDSHGYAVRGCGPKIKRKTIRMHRVISGAENGLDVDHKNRNTLDNRRENLRVVCRSQNNANSVRHKSSSGYKGVSWHAQDKMWRARVYCNRKEVYSELFDDPIDAAKAYDTHARKVFGEFARTNF